MKSLFITGVLICFASVAGSAQAASDEEVARLREQIKLLSQRLDELERSSANIQVEHPTSAVAAKSTWADNIRLKGDLRYRYEGISEEGQDTRERNRIRARLEIAAQVHELVDLGFRLATGGDRPTSGNQSLDTGFSRKAFGLDRAYFSWRAADGLTVTGGKMKNPVYRPNKSQLIWDNDLNPEGLALQYANGNFFGTAFGYYTEERSSGPDSYLLGAQGGYKFPIRDDTKLTLGAGYYDHLNVEGNLPLFSGAPLGNTVDVNGNLVNDYDELELFAELATRVGELPLSIILDWVQNLDADTADTGYRFGVQLGKLGGSQTWQVAAFYEDIEADATLALFNDSNFAGGGTDGSGFVLQGGYAISKHLRAVATYFSNERGADAGDERDFDRVQVDMKFDF